MRSIAATLQYIFKNFLFIFVFALIPSYFFAASLDLENIRALAQALLSAENPEFLQVFSFLSFVNARGWVFSVICLILLVICLPLLFGFIEKHMRIGSRSLKGILSRFNYNFLSTLVVLVCVLAVYELWALVTAGLLYGESVLLGGIACFIVILLTLVGMTALICYLASVILLWLPCMQITGYGFMESLSYANQLNANVRGKVFLAVFLPCLACFLLQFAAIIPSAMAGIEFPVFIVYELIYLIMILYYSALMFVVCFDAAGEERLDIRKKL